ncbi:MAG TPA: methyltransferase domain-containing protein [Gemmataceae bacterium]|nr:methyltransferase domain-containing protein [Gemmataceae bacterium]
MELKEVQRHWDAFGKTDPLWAIMTRPDKRHGRWKAAEFFASGEEEIQRLMGCIASLAFPLRPGRALDFGCGVGRLTQALSRYFEESHGVDIAPSMIALAREYDRPGRRFRCEMARLWSTWRSGHFRWADRWPGFARLLKGKCCHYAVNDSGKLALFHDDTFDFVYSRLVLQHMKPEYSLNYIKEFLRVLAPGGLLVFQIPSHPLLERATPYKACIRMRQPSLTIRPGKQSALLVQVKNASDLTWPAVNLGNHWLSETGELLVADDGRVALPTGMRPGQEVQVSITITAPKRPGQYWLELDVVQELVTWFQHMGSETSRIPCQVQGRGPNWTDLSRKFKRWLRARRGYGLAARLYRKLHRRGEPATPGFEPVMETYGVPREELVKWIENHGGRIVDIQHDWAVGKDWESFRYYVTKS